MFGIGDSDMRVGWPQCSFAAYVHEGGGRVLEVGVVNLRLAREMLGIGGNRFNLSHNLLLKEPTAAEYLAAMFRLPHATGRGEVTNRFVPGH